MNNFGQLKVDLMRTGVYIPPETSAIREISDGFMTGKTKDEITLAFSEDFFVKTFFYMTFLAKCTQ